MQVHRYTISRPRRDVSQTLVPKRLAPGRGRRIVRNLIREIDTRTMNGPCEAFSNDLRLKVGRSGRYVYPDVMVVCGEQQMEDDVHDTLLNPSLVIEVVSPHTEAYDRGEKFEHYRTIGTLVEYVLVAQDRISIERFTRRGDFWMLAPVQTVGVLPLESIRCEIPVEALYHRVQFPPAKGQTT